MLIRFLLLARSLSQYKLVNAHGLEALYMLLGWLAASCHLRRAPRGVRLRGILRETDKCSERLLTGDKPIIGLACAECGKRSGNQSHGIC